MDVLQDRQLIERACELLRAGQLVSFPTETVYGLGADASNADALHRLYQTKGRPAAHPVIVHISSLDQLAMWTKQVPEQLSVLAQRFWPGPLTVVLKRSERVLDQVTGGQATVAIRMPAHPVALALLNEFGGGLAAPSANRFGRLSPTEAEDVRREFGSEVALVLDGGRCTVGIESTILDLSDDVPRILRPGMILPCQLEDALDRKVEVVETGAHGSVRVPGGLPGHYAPRTPLKLVASANFVGEVESLLDSNISVAVLSFQPAVTGLSSESWLQTELNAVQYARLLYASLRKLDQRKAALILVEEPPDLPDWAGVRDRLRRAQHGVL